MVDWKIQMITLLGAVEAAYESYIGKWCYLTDPRCKGQLCIASQVTLNGMRMLNVGIVPFDEFRLATEKELTDWVNR